MVALEEVERLATGFPGVTVGQRYGHRTWFVRKKAFAWERPFSKADVARFGAETPPAGPILAVLVDDLGEKEAVLAAAHAGFFTIPHFDGYPAVLIDLDAATGAAVAEALEDAWLAAAPATLTTAYLDARG